MKKNLIIDALIFGAFLIAFEPRLTGEPIHEWLSLALAAAFIVHMLLHWDWIINVGAKFFRRLFHSSRLNFVVDVALLIAMVTVMVSGLFISRTVMPALGLATPEGQVWRFLHSSSADLSLILVGIHFALHWKWIVSALKRYVIQPVAGMFKRAPQPELRLAPVAVKEDEAK